MLLHIPISSALSFSGAFPNKLLLQLRSHIILVPKPNRPNPSMTDVRNLIAADISKDSVVRKVNNKGVTGRGGKCNPKERLAIRKMMSRCWDNHTPFAMDLCGAIIRQGSFIDKMHSLHWLHSPASQTTMSRLLVKYDRFFQIMVTNPGRVAVPTLDVDLAWHTHQLSPRSYYSYSLSNTAGGRFINHNDKLTKISSRLDSNGQVVSTRRTTAKSTQNALVGTAKVRRPCLSD